MATRITPGTAVPGVTEAARKSWYVFKHFNAGSSQDPMLSYIAGYRRGVGDMTSDMLELGGWDMLTRRLLAVLEEIISQREAVQYVAQEQQDG